MEEKNSYPAEEGIRASSDDSTEGAIRNGDELHRGLKPRHL